MFKLAIEVCFENYFGLIHAIFSLLGSTKSVYFFLGHPVQYIMSYYTVPSIVKKDIKSPGIHYGWHLQIQLI